MTRRGYRPAMTQPFDVADLRHVFLQEAEERLAAIEQALIELERHPAAAEPLNEVFRSAHTIKGGAATVGFDHTAEYAHLLEDALDAMREGAVTSQRITLLLQAVDAMRGMLAAESSGRMTLIRRADRALIESLIPAEAREARSGSRIDEPEAEDAAHLVEDALTAAEELDRLLADLQERIMGTRLVPLGPAFRQQRRTVRVIASAQGKLVELVLIGEDVEVDASIVEQMRDPLMHMVRNAIDHGIEYPAARAATPHHGRRESSA
jgi:two-component system, chemotaxis family, sensor kinase CheA